VTIDAASLDRVDAIRSRDQARFDSVPLLNIDHHASNIRFGQAAIVDPNASSVCELLFDILGDLGIVVDATIGYCLLTGIIGDTRGFRTSSTTGRTLEVAAALVASGVSIHDVADAVHRYRGPAEVRAWADVLARSTFTDGVLWTILRPEDTERYGIPADGLEGIVEFLSDTRDVSVSIVFKPQGTDRVRVSMRSDGRVDLTLITGMWGGGGHARAAGCTLVGVTADAAATLVVDATIAALRASKPTE
jgi:phosphoesterase RecJ-like protein